MAKFNLYSVKDKVEKVSIFRGVFQCSSDDAFMRNCLFSVLMDYPLRDIEVYQVGMFDDDTGEITPCPHRLLDLSQGYHFPRSTTSPNGDDLSLDELEKGAKEFKANQQARLALQIEHERNEKKVKEE